MTTLLKADHELPCENNNDIMVNYYIIKDSLYV